MFPFGRRAKKRDVEIAESLEPITQQPEQPITPRGDRLRGFFVYRDDQQKEHIVDPFRVFRQLANDPEVNVDECHKAAMSAEEPETTKLVDFLCRVFDVKPFDPVTQTGMTDWEIIDLLGQFQAYLEDLKKNIDPGSTSSEPTDSTPSEDSTDDPLTEPPTQPTEDSLPSSTSTANV